MLFRILIIASATLFLTGCSQSELDRCISANVESIDSSTVKDWLKKPEYAKAYEEQKVPVDKYNGMSCGLNETDECKVLRADGERLYLELERKVEKEIAKNICQSQGVY